LFGEDCDGVCEVLAEHSFVGGGDFIAKGKGCEGCKEHYLIYAAFALLILVSLLGSELVPSVR